MAGYTERAEYLTLAMAAEYLSVSIKTVRRRIAAGDFSAYRLGPKVIRVRRADLDAAMREFGGRTWGDVA